MRAGGRYLNGEATRLVRTKMTMRMTTTTTMTYSTWLSYEPRLKPLLPRARTSGSGDNMASIAAEVKT